MAKVKVMPTASLPSKGSLKLLKEGGVQKKKNQNFKKTPGGKIALINGSKGRNSNSKPQMEFEKAGSAPKSPESPQVKSKRKKQQLQSPQKLNASIKDLVPKEEESDSEEDINEGIVLEEELSFVQDGEIDDDDDDDEDDDDEDEEDDDDDEEEEGGVKVADLLGASLADETDEDDEDFEETEEDEEKKVDGGKDKKKRNESNEVQQNKGVKMFKGLKSKNKNDDAQNKNSKQNKSASDNNNSSSMDEEDDDSEYDNNEIASEEVEFENSEEEEDDEDDDGDEDDDDDDEDDDDDDEEEEEEEENTLGLQALLGNSIADDDDDEDFEGDEEDDEDEDISDEEDEEGEENNSTLNTTKDSSVNDSTTSADLTEEEKEQRDKQTIFVGNLPRTVTKPQLIKLFKKFGPVESVRLRGAVPEQTNVPKKVAGITKKLHPQLKAVIGYVVFKSEDSVKAALSMNGKVFEGHYLRVDTIFKNENETYDPKKTVFLGNLPYMIDNNSIWEFFKDCGQIESVRVIRDNKSGTSKGIGYVNFTSEDAVALALELNGQELGKREIRIKPCTSTSVGGKKEKSKQFGKRSHSNESANENSPKKFKSNAEAALHRKKQKGQKAGGKNSSADKQTFEGQKADKKKKHKTDKTQKKKKFLAGKLMAKSKKPTK